MKFKNYINGQFIAGTTHFDSVSPGDGEIWAQMPAADEMDVNLAVASAKDALNRKDWTSLTASQRGKLLYRLAELVEDNAEHLAEMETKDTGKIIRETSAQISYVADFYRYYAGVADKLEGTHLPIDRPDMEVWLRREPVGVVAAIIPWNSQLFLSAVKIGPAVAAGCTIVLKASEDGPAPMLEFAKVVDKAGFPPGVINIISGFGEDCGKVLSSHPDIAKIAFTGGPVTARHIVRNSANNLASTSLELGGKSPFVVFEDCDIEAAVNAQVAAIFMSSGQSCVAGSRLIIHRSVKSKFLSRLKSQVKQIRIGSPLDLNTQMGPLCTERQRTFVNQVVNETTEYGAELVLGGQNLDRPGFYFEPTVLDCTDHIAAPSVRKELFAPVLSILSFNDEEEALSLANDSSYGLAAGVFTKDVSTAHRMTKNLRAGVVWVNTYRDISPIAPFGGFGISGHGREGGVEAVLEYTATKAVWLRTAKEPFPNPFSN